MKLFTADFIFVDRPFVTTKLFLVNAIFYGFQKTIRKVWFAYKSQTFWMTRLIRRSCVCSLPLPSILRHCSTLLLPQRNQQKRSFCKKDDFYWAFNFLPSFLWNAYIALCFATTAVIVVGRIPSILGSLLWNLLCRVRKQANPVSSLGSQKGHKKPTRRNELLYTRASKLGGL